MMIDTLRASKRLIESGFNEDQAQSIVDTVINRNEELATKNDVNSLKNDVNSLRWMIGISLVLNTIAISGIIAILIAK